jgi:RING finger/CHY zinc finger protein 1
MPKEYENLEAHILCNDCEKKSVVKMHFIAMKCPECSSYNTQQIATPK